MFLVTGPMVSDPRGVYAVVCMPVRLDGDGVSEPDDRLIPHVTVCRDLVDMTRAYESIITDSGAEYCHYETCMTVAVHYLPSTITSIYVPLTDRISLTACDIESVSQYRDWLIEAGRDAVSLLKTGQRSNFTAI